MLSGDGAAAPALAQDSSALDALVPRRGRMHAVITTARPRQWVKNALVVAAPGAAGVIGRDDVPGRIVIACLAFCALATGIYAINDVRDAPEDRRHPVKCRRPVACGELGARTAVTLGIASLGLGLGLCVAVSPWLGVIGAAYLVLTLSYTMIWRYVLYLDVLAIAGGFMLRAAAGGAAAPVDLSEWFLLVVSCAAVLVASGKRWAEFGRTQARGGTGRGVLKRYTRRRLQVLLVGSAVGAMFAYCMWAFAVPATEGVPWRPLTVIPFVACLLRYGSLISTGEGEAPEEMIIGDRLLLLSALTWIMLFACEVGARA